MNSLLFKIKYHGPTNNKGSRISIESSDIAHRNNDKPLRKYFSWDYSQGTSSLDQGLAKLSAFKIVGTNDRLKDCSIVLVEWEWEKLCNFFGVKLI